MSWNSGRRRRRCPLNNDKHGQARKVWCGAARLPRSRSKHSDCDTEVWPQMATDVIETAWRCVARISELVSADVPSGRGSSGGIPWYGQRDRGNRRLKPTFNDGQRGGFVNRSGWVPPTGLKPRSLKQPSRKTESHGGRGRASSHEAQPYRTPIPSNRPRSYDDAAVIEHTTGATLS